MTEKRIPKSQIKNFTAELLSSLDILYTGQKRCLVMRYGAIGDNMMASSILPGLKEQGFHVVYLTEALGEEILRHDPHIDEFMIVSRETIHKDDLWIFWNELAPHFDKVVNLFESTEGSVIAWPHDIRCRMPVEARDALCGMNYVELLHKIAGVPYKGLPRIRFYSTEEERVKAKARWITERPLLTWILEGSTFFKYYPFTPDVILRLARELPVNIALVGAGDHAQEIQKEIFKRSEEGGFVHSLVNAQTIREALAWAERSDCVIGPETGLMLAASMLDMPKVLYLSHSTHNNLTRDWKNTMVLAPNREIAPCYPCHRMHIDKRECPQDEMTNSALCASSIDPDTFFTAIVSALVETGKLKPLTYEIV